MNTERGERGESMTDIREQAAKAAREWNDRQNFGLRHPFDVFVIGYLAGHAAAKAEAYAIPCLRCDGSGRIPDKQSTAGTAVCPNCWGNGWKVKP
jgi:hypothetical protein